MSTFNSIFRQDNNLPKPGDTMQNWQTDEVSEIESTTVINGVVVKIVLKNGVTFDPRQNSVWS